MKKIALFIVEGIKAEIAVVDSLQKNFIKGIHENIKVIPYTTDIYQLYNALQEDGEFLDLLEILKEQLSKNSENLEKLEILEEIEINDIAYTYLFFDYDAHTHHADNEKLKKMIQYFNDETEVGKLYISYPMVESLRHIKQKDDLEFINRIVNGKIKGKEYKAQVHNETCYQQIKKLTLEDWLNITELNIKKANNIIFSDSTTPSFRRIREINQENINESQMMKYIEKAEQVAVLSGFPFFIVDYLNEEKYLEYYGREIDDNK
ncbi:MAG: hypothetical protein ACRCZ9_13080 [Fusobacteriaceae bacterium]